MTASTAPARPAASAAFHHETVLSVRHYNDDLFAFRITRPASFRFRAGEFVMIGLEVEGQPRPILRAYSIASPAWDEGLDFYSIKAPGGALTERLKLIKEGDTVLMGKKPTGTLVLDALSPGRRLFLFSSGTGIAPFISLMREPETYERFDQVILTHTCRTKVELQYGFDCVAETFEDPLVGEEAKAKLVHYTSVTREDGPHVGRITTLLESGTLFEHLGQPGLAPETDRAMMCGSEPLLRDLKDILLARGFVEGSNAKPAAFTIEKAFVG